MQTFLPYPRFDQTASILDRQRLGKQRVECKQILMTLTGQSRGWVNHPAIRMWAGYEWTLRAYTYAICAEWINRGYRDTIRDWLTTLDLPAHRAPVVPPWLGDPAFHLSHQSNLVRKMPAHYRAFFPDVPDDLPYVWPASEKSSNEYAIQVTS